MDKLLASFGTYLAGEGYAPKSIRMRQQGLQAWAAWAGKGPGALELGDLVGYLSYLSEAGHTVNYRYQAWQVARRWYAFLRAGGFRSDDPSAALRLPSRSGGFGYRFLSEAELGGLLASYQGAYPSDLSGTLALSLYIYQGATTADLGGLQADSLDAATGLLALPGSERVCPRRLPLQVRQALWWQACWAGEGSGAWFRAPHLANRAYKLMKRLRGLHPEGVSARQLRGSRIVLWLAAHNLRQVQYRAGHARVTSTERYRVGQVGDLGREIDRFHPLG